MIRSTEIVRANPMFFFKRKKNHEAEATLDITEIIKKEAEIQKIRQEYIKPAEEVARKADSILELLNNNEILGQTELIFYATPGGGKELSKRKKR